MTISPQTIATALSFLSTAAPEVAAIYSVIRAIWLSANPGKSEGDYIAFLIHQSSQLVSDADAILTQQGYLRDATTGVWSKPATA
jgi:hypothetical protein